MAGIGTIHLSSDHETLQHCLHELDISRKAVGLRFWGGGVSSSVIGVLPGRGNIPESVWNNQNFARCQLHQVLCLQKSTQGLISVIYTVVAQKDGRINVTIAKAAKEDSSSMTNIALLGIVFLPSMCIATLFSMSMFDFFSSTSQASTNSTSETVSWKFWIFWAVAIPLTLIIFAFWKIWIGRMHKGGSQAEEALMMAEVTAYRGIRDHQGISSVLSQEQRAYLGDNPFYPMARSSHT